ncbi:hypothetical protein SFRURICE_001229 [Spodoptera frugiperda]|uniref:SFRICE_006307 n=1 Tax=Spodoptera frugiperda TaxID=7108 RepID=A0A2H1WXF3_SPOFR|nr:uncharacterized protein LOC118264194 [Spodoptera frugiperda]KAF9806434.1 hypothetical protein SFRURICE_001229 [Spodoptera frugiperda]
MIVAFVLFGLSLVASYNKSSVNMCLWHNNTCVDICPEWMIQRKSNCSASYWPAQKTCEHPEQMLVGTVCGFSRCDCPDPLVLDTETGFCYDVDNCPTKHMV